MVNTRLALGVLALLPALGDLQQPSTAKAVAEKVVAQKAVVVSLQRIATESSDGRAASQRLQALLQKMTLDLAAKQKELAQPTGPEFQRLAQQSQLDYANAQRQAQAELRAKVAPIVADVAAQRGADLVLNSDAVIWTAARLDVTSEVIAKLDSK